VILAIDTSTDQAGAALATHDGTLAEWSWVTRGNHSRHLSHVLRELLRLQDMAASSLSAVIVAHGPGSFSGVRVGVSQAKGLAMALQVPLVGISTLDVIAFQASSASEEVWAITSAGRQYVNLARYTGRGDAWKRLTEYRIASLLEAAEQVRGAEMLAGDGADGVAAVVRQQGEDVTLEPVPWRLRRAGFLAELGGRYLEAGGSDQLDLLEPLYLRGSAAEEKLATERQE